MDSLLGILRAEKHNVGFVDLLVEVGLVGKEQVDLDNILVDDHTGNLSGVVLAEDGEDLRIDKVANELSARVSVSESAEGSEVRLGQRNVDLLLSRRLLLLLLHERLLGRGLLETGSGHGLRLGWLRHLLLNIRVWLGLVLILMATTSGVRTSPVSATATSTLLGLLVVASVLLIHEVVCTVLGASRHRVRPSVRLHVALALLLTITRLLVSLSVGLINLTISVSVLLLSFAFLNNQLQHLLEVLLSALLLLRGNLLLGEPEVYLEGFAAKHA